MINVLISAYACCPNKGSEPGMAWNWIANIVQYCNVDVITSCEFKSEVESSLSTLQFNNKLTFHFIDIGEKATRMGQNQGDWRFYFFYHLWQRKVLKKAVEICRSKEINLLHQLNMIGYREPGLLWKIKTIPLIWGPIGGFGHIPISYLSMFETKDAIKQFIKNLINNVQIIQPNILRAIQRSDILLAANSTDKKMLSRFKKKNVMLFPAVATKINSHRLIGQRDFNNQLKLVWVGKNAPRKALYIALKTMVNLSKSNITLDIIGVGKSEIAEQDFKNLINVSFHPWMPHSLVQEKIGQSHLLIFTSLFESTGTVVMESISLGVPVVLHDTCGQGDIIDQNCGVKVPLKSPLKSIEGFTNAILGLHNDRKHLETLSKGALVRAGQITWEKKTNELISYYEKVSQKNIINNK